MKVTPAQYRVLSAIQSLSDSQGYVPSQQQIATQLGVSQQAIHKHINAMVDRGVVKRTPGMPNTLEIVEGV